MDRQSSPQKCPCGTCTTNHDAALCWFNFGITVIPIVPNEKRPSVKWTPWIEDIALEKIKKYWTDHPDHELGMIVGSNVIVFDADDPKSIKSLENIENSHGIKPDLIVKTRRGEHHYFCLEPGTLVKSDSHDSNRFPERIDVKTGRSLTVLPPSSGKTLDICKVEKLNRLCFVGQDFINSVFLMNGRRVPEQKPASRMQSLCEGKEQENLKFQQLKALLNHIDPDCGYQDWLFAIIAVHTETGGHPEGLKLADAWSSNGEKYKGFEEVELKWQSINTHSEGSIRLGTLCKLVNENGYDAHEILAKLEPDFQIETHQESINNPLSAYSLRGYSEDLEKEMQAETPVLEGIALSGQLTILYAAPNTGKTLATLHLLIEGIERGNINADKLYYVNVDDTASGLIEKLKIAELYNFHMLAEGYQGFEAKSFVSIIRKMVEKNQVKGVVIILDTLKKFVDIMLKSQCSDFTKDLRAFVLKGGTLIALAHTNKNRNNNNELVHAGTTDFMDDSDCVYLIDTLTSSTEKDEKVIEFINKKRRGNVLERVSYRYDNRAEVNYIDRLLSVQILDGQSAEAIKIKEREKTDAEVISAIMSCIEEGIITKMAIVKKAREKSGASKSKVIEVVDKYSGDTSQHKWSYHVKAHGRQEFYILAKC